MHFDLCIFFHASRVFLYRYSKSLDFCPTFTQTRRCTPQNCWTILDLSLFRCMSIQHWNYATKIQWTFVFFLSDHWVVNMIDRSPCVTSSFSSVEGSRGSARNVSNPPVHFISFSCSFLGNFCQHNRLDPPLLTKAGRPGYRRGAFAEEGQLWYSKPVAEYSNH